MIDKKFIGKVCKDIIQKDNEELFAKKQEELEEYWHYRFNKTGNIEWSYYEFFKALDLYKHYCTRWEEHHNGSVCVVERVRDKYLLPKINKFIGNLLKEGK